MLKIRNRLLIAVILFVVTTCTGLYGEAGARGFARPGSDSQYRHLKPGAGVNTGEPDVGESGKNNGPPSAGTSGGSGVQTTPAPTGYRWIIAVWAARYRGVGW